MEFSQEDCHYQDYTGRGHWNIHDYDDIHLAITVIMTISSVRERYVYPDPPMTPAARVGITEAKTVFPIQRDFLKCKKTQKKQ